MIQGQQEIRGPRDYVQHTHVNRICDYEQGPKKGSRLCCQEQQRRKQMKENKYSRCILCEILLGAIVLLHADCAAVGAL